MNDLLLYIISHKVFVAQYEKVLKITILWVHYSYKTLKPLKWDNEFCIQPKLLRLLSHNIYENRLLKKYAF